MQNTEGLHNNFNLFGKSSTKLRKNLSVQRSLCDMNYLSMSYSEEARQQTNMKTQKNEPL